MSGALRPGFGHIPYSVPVRIWRRPGQQGHHLRRPSRASMTRWRRVPGGRRQRQPVVPDGIPAGAESCQGSWLDDRGPERRGQHLEQRCIGAGGRASSMWATRASADSHSAISTSDVGVVEHLVARAAKEAGLARSCGRDHALEQTLELIPPAGFGLQFDDHLDGQLILPPSRHACDANSRPHLPAGQPLGSPRLGAPPGPPTARPPGPSQRARRRARHDQPQPGQGLLNLCPTAVRPRRGGPGRAVLGRRQLRLLITP